jgi:hypothetical protein
MKINFGVLEEKLREGKLKNLRYDLQWQQNVFTVATEINEAAVQASLVIPQIITKKSNHLRMLSV